MQGEINADYHPVCPHLVSWWAGGQWWDTRLAQAQAPRPFPPPHQASDCDRQEKGNLQQYATPPLL